MWSNTYTYWKYSCGPIHIHIGSIHVFLYIYILEVFMWSYIYTYWKYSCGPIHIHVRSIHVVLYIYILEVFMCSYTYTCWKYSCGSIRPIHTRVILLIPMESRMIISKILWSTTLFINTRKLNHLSYMSPSEWIQQHPHLVYQIEKWECRRLNIVLEMVKKELGIILWKCQCQICSCQKVCRFNYFAVGLFSGLYCKMLY